MLLKNAVDCLPNLVFWKDKNHVYLGCNRNFSDHFDLDSPGDVLGKTDEDLKWDPKCLEQLHAEEDYVFATKEARKDIVQVLLINNKPPITARLDFIPFFSDTGEIAGVLVFAIPLNNKDLVHNVFFSHMLENIPYYIFWKDVDSVYLGCNENFAHLIGMKVEEIVGKTDRDLKWGVGEAELFIQADKNIIAGNKQINLEEELMQPDGRKIVMLVSKTPVYNQENHVIGLLGISVDITELKQTQIELIKAKEIAEESDRIKTLFMENMSHDFRTPMNGIYGIVQLLEIHKDEFSDEVNELVYLQGKSVRRLNKLVTSILDYNKIKAGKVEIERNDLNLLEIIESVVHNLSFNLKNKPVDIQIYYPPDMPRHFISDSYCVTSIILNLMSNAVKFTKEGQVTISVKMASQDGKDALIEITIEDTGRGIPSDKLTQIFDRFHRLEMSNTGLTEGHGVGLSVVKELLDKLNGSIQVKSELEKGSTFTLQLPFEVLEMPFFISTWKKKYPDVRVLLGSDKDVNAIGNQLGEKAITIVRSKEIINTLLSAAHTKNPYHIIIIDDEVKMLSALDFICTVLSIKEIPQLLWLLSSKPQDKEWFDRARMAGYFDFMIKPILPTELDEKLTTAWEHWSQRH